MNLFIDYPALAPLPGRASGDTSRSNITIHQSASAPLGRHAIGDKAKFNLSVSHSSSAQLSNGEGFAHQEQGQEQYLISESFAGKEVLLDLGRSRARRLYPMPRRLDGHRKLQHDPDVTAGNALYHNR